MDSLIALVGKDYVLMAADTSLARSIIVMKHDEDKILPLDSSKMMGMTGEQGDREQFGDYVQKNLELTFYRTGHRLSTAAAAHWTRNQLARFLRSSPYQVNCLIGGFDAATGPSLYFMDYLASMHKVKFAAHGYAGYMVLGLMDRLYRDDMTLEQGLEVMQAAIEQIQRRLLINAPSFVIKIVDSEGYRVVVPAVPK
jgi:20S proteasome subunit beta 4